MSIHPGPLRGQLCSAETVLIVDTLHVVPVAGVAAEVFLEVPAGEMWVVTSAYAAALLAANPTVPIAAAIIVRTELYVRRVGGALGGGLAVLDRRHPVVEGVNAAGGPCRHGGGEIWVPRGYGIGYSVVFGIPTAEALRLSIGGIAVPASDIR